MSHEVVNFGSGIKSVPVLEAKSKLFLLEKAHSHQYFELIDLSMKSGAIETCDAHLFAPEVRLERIT